MTEGTFPDDLDDASHLLTELQERHLHAADWEAVAEPLAELHAAWLSGDADRFRIAIEELSVGMPLRVAQKLVQPVDPTLVPPPREILEVINPLVRKISVPQSISVPEETGPDQAKNGTGR